MFSYGGHHLTQTWLELTGADWSWQPWNKDLETLIHYDEPCLSAISDPFTKVHEPGLQIFVQAWQQDTVSGCHINCSIFDKFNADPCRQKSSSFVNQAESGMCALQSWMWDGAWKYFNAEYENISLAERDNRIRLSRVTSPGNFRSPGSWLEFTMKQ